MRPPRRCPAPPRAPGCPAPIPSAGPIPCRRRRASGHGHREHRARSTQNLGAVRAARIALARCAPRALGRAARAPRRRRPSRFSLFRFLLGPRAGAGAGAGAPAPAPLAPAPFAPLAFRRLAPVFSPARFRFIQRTRSATSRTPFAGRFAAIFTYRHSESYAPSAYVSSPSSSVFCSSSDHETSYRLVPIFVFVIFFCDAFGGSAPPSSAFASRSTERDAVASLVFSCVSVVVTDVPSLFPRATEEGGPVGMGSPSRFAPSAWDVLGSVDVSAAPARVILAQPGVQGLGWEGSARSGTRRVRTTRWLRSDRRGLGRGGDEASAGESGAWNHPMAPKKPRRASRVRRGTNGARFAGRQQSCPRPPRSTGRAERALIRFFARREKSNGASERAGRRLPSPTRAYRYRAETMCAVVCDLPDARRVEGTQAGIPTGSGRLLPADVLYDTSFHRFRSAF